MRLARKILGVGTAAMIALDPSLGAVGVDFHFPDRQPVFDVIDYIAAREKGVSSVLGSDANPDGDISCFECACAMDYSRVFELKPSRGLVEYGCRDGRGECRVSVVVEFGDGFSFIVVAHPAFVAAIGPRAKSE